MFLSFKTFAQYFTVSSTDNLVYKPINRVLKQDNHSRSMEGSFYYSATPTTKEEKDLCNEMENTVDNALEDNIIEILGGSDDPRFCVTTFDDLDFSEQEYAEFLSTQKKLKKQDFAHKRIGKKSMDKIQDHQKHEIYEDNKFSGFEKESEASIEAKKNTKSNFSMHSPLHLHASNTPRLSSSLEDVLKNFTTKIDEAGNPVFVYAPELISQNKKVCAETTCIQDQSIDYSSKYSNSETIHNNTFKEKQDIPCSENEIRKPIDYCALLNELEENQSSSDTADEWDVVKTKKSKTAKYWFEMQSKKK